MEERKVTVDLQHYEDLVERSERLACLERLLESKDYISTGNVKSILGLGEMNGKL